MGVVGVLTWGGAFGVALSGWGRTEVNETGTETRDSTASPITGNLSASYDTAAQQGRPVYPILCQGLQSEV